MKKQGLWVVVSVLVVLGLILASCAKAPAAPTTPTTPVTPVAPAKPAVIKWKTELSGIKPVEPRFPGMAANFDEFYYGVLEQTFPGRIEFTFAPPGSLVPEVDKPVGVGKGIIDSGTGYGPFYTGYLPEGHVEAGLPFAWEEPAHLYDAYYNLGLLPLLEEAYAELNVWPQPFSIGSLQNILAKGIASDLSWFKGKKVRATGLWQDWVKALGASAVLVPRPDSYMAMKLGTADAMLFSVTALEDMKLYEVVDSVVVYPNTLDMSITMYYNMDFLEALPDDIKTFVKNESKRILLWYAIRRGYTEMRWYPAKYEQSGQIKQIRWSEADANYVRKLGYSLWAKVENLSPRTTKMLEIVRKQMRDYGKM